MGTSSLTFIYNNDGKLILIMYRQYDGYLSGHGLDLALFLNDYLYKVFLPDYLSKLKLNHVSLSESINMKHLANELFDYFKKTQDKYIELVPMNDPYYWCHDYEYHIFVDRVNIVGIKKIEVNWVNDEFRNLCEEDNEENEEEEEEEDNEEDEEEEEEEDEEEEEEDEEEEDNFGKVDWNLWEIEHDTFGKVNWDNIESLARWTKPETGYCSQFKFNNIVYLRDYDDFIWSIEDDGSPRDIVGRFDNEKEMIVEVDYKIED